MGPTMVTPAASPLAQQATSVSELPLRWQAPLRVRSSRRALAIKCGAMAANRRGVLTTMPGRFERAVMGDHLWARPSQVVALPVRPQYGLLANGCMHPGGRAVPNPSPITVLKPPCLTTRSKPRACITAADSNGVGLETRASASSGGGFLNAAGSGLMLPQEGRLQQGASGCDDFGVSRRAVLLALGSGVLMLDRTGCALADDDLHEASPAAVSGRGPAPVGAPAAPKPNVVKLDKAKWRRFQGERYTFVVPRDYFNTTAEYEAAINATVYMEKKGIRPFEVRFESGDGDCAVSLVQRDANTLRLSLLQTTDIKDFGSPDQAAKVLLPPQAELIRSRQFVRAVDRSSVEKLRLPLDLDANLDRTYYVYEFTVVGRHFALSAAASRGRVFVLGASSSEATWDENAQKLSTVAASFVLEG